MNRISVPLIYNLLYIFRILSKMGCYRLFTNEENLEFAINLRQVGKYIRKHLLVAEGQKFSFEIVQFLQWIRGIKLFLKIYFPPSEKTNGG